MSEPFGVFDDPRVKANREVYNKYAFESLPKDRYAKDRWIMANVHLLIGNSFEAAYKNATYINKGDLANYIAFAEQVILALEGHHELEEKTLFPMYETKITMQKNVDEHALFLGGIHEALEYLRAADPKRHQNPAPFDAQAFRRILDGCLVEMFQHLADELQTLDPEVMRNNFTADFLIEAENKVEEQLKHKDPFMFLPMAVRAVPPGHHFPPIPWLARSLVLPVLSLKHRALWKYTWQARKWETSPPSQTH